MSVPRKRLDQVLIERGLFASRAKARAAIKNGLVHVEGELVAKPSQTVADHVEITVDPLAHRYVSRAALKLVHGLDHFGIDPRGLECLDIGASTGGFTQVLLERGAKHVTAIDVGHGQLAPEIASDPRVTMIEGLNARDLGINHLSAPPELITCDVSFIGLHKAAQKALDLSHETAHFCGLIKPQFEVGPENVGKGGIVRDAGLHAKVCDNVVAWLAAQPHWTVLGLTESPIEGGDGNKEFLIAARRTK
ncbi:MAG: TlyA family RNA methyltransferase [Parvibaculum sp.]|uniref:TlyA family RNA methyltransferase n=1 Tax=Parvibaculum sp. TaxID=2024848 RepID=UPI0025DF476D|nr:TlyA family RNA methyltransferase [Parvibaculum sp.]MCE9649692.1 TlyA family RNA methyltransferase [Parvibaculum sp.]